MKQKIFDRALLAVGLLALAGSALFLALSWRAMPDQIPTHFDAAGQIDGWGPKSTALILPILGVLMFGMFQFIALLCSGMKKTGGVRPMLAMETMCRLLAVLTALVFAYMTICSVRAVPLGRWFMAVFLGAGAVILIACIAWACIPKRE